MYNFSISFRSYQDKPSDDWHLKVSPDCEHGILYGYCDVSMLFISKINHEIMLDG